MSFRQHYYLLFVPFKFVFRFLHKNKNNYTKKVYEKYLRTDRLRCNSPNRQNFTC